MNNNLPTVPNFPQLEKDWLIKWEKNKIFSKYLNKNKDSDKRFFFLDGPITANNPMGVHHGWGRTYKDLWQKFHNLLGDKQRFQNGFDCQGLWVEVEVEKELGLKTKQDIENLVPGDKKASIAKFVNLCKERVARFAKIQTEQSQRLGYFMDWKHSYFTLSDANNYTIWHFLKVCADNNWIYKGKESVPWCPRCETAISQHEMLTEDYKEVTHEAIYLKLPLQDRHAEYLLVWTTTPWTIPANIAVAVDQKIDYALVEGDGGEKYWVAKALVKSLFPKNTKLVKTIKGKELVGLKYSAPFDNLPAVRKVALANPKTFHTIIATDDLIMPISINEGTGLVHTAVSAGTEDYKLGKKHGLPMIPVIGDNADYLAGLDFLSGKNAKKKPRLILDYLETENWSFKIENYTHRYPACWRCKTELVWKVEKEWYIAMDKPAKKTKQTIRQTMIKVTKQIKWIPDFGLQRELDWLNNMHDWLISKKNRYWGLALPIYECSSCKNFMVIGSKADLEKQAVSGWDKFKGNSPHKPWIDEVKISCSKCQRPISRIKDVGNPWLDAGIVTYSTLIDPKTEQVSYLTDQKYWSEWFPADFITESFPGQFKNWFYSLIAMSSVLEQKPPFKTILGYATVVGEDGRAMHKSWGNAIEFNEGADKIGVDVMRWMYARQDPKKNLLFGPKKANEVRRRFHIRLWNVLKFFTTYADLDKWSVPVTLNEADLSKLPLILLDQWILSEYTNTLKVVKDSLQKYNSEKAAKAIETLVDNLSLWYLRLSRDRVWNNSKDKQDKTVFYTVVYYILSNLTIILSPFLPFFSEEIYSILKGKQKSVHLENWPTLIKIWFNKSLNKQMVFVRDLAEIAHSQRKTLVIKVRQPLAKATYSLSEAALADIENNKVALASLLATELNVKQISFVKAKSTESSPTVVLDTVLTEELKWEGLVRGYIRKIQRLRQKQGFNVNDQITVVMPKVPEPYLTLIKEKVLAKSIKFSVRKQIEIISAE